MSAEPRAVTRPEDRVGLTRMIAYGLGGFVNNTLAAAIGGMLIVLNLGLGMDPALVGLVGALPRLTDALTDPMMGYISDHTRSRWGRRRPYIFGGALASALVFAVLWWLPRGQTEGFYFAWFLVGSILFYLAYTVFATPWVALGYELTPDYHERTRLMGTQSFISQLAYVVSPWFLWIMTNDRWFVDQVEGARWLAVLVAVVVASLGVLPALVLVERKAEGQATTAAVAGLAANLADFFRGLFTTLRSGPFLKLGAATFLVFNGFILISAFQSYVIIYYVFGGDQLLGAKWSGYAGTVGAISTFVVIAFVTWLGTRIGKRRAFFVTIGISMVGYALKWVCYDPATPWLLLLPAPLMAFGLGGLFPLMGAMVADVVDLDELQTRQRREGMYGSIFWWVVKLGMAAALAGGGLLLNATGFDVALGAAQTPAALTLMRLCDAFIPVLASALAIWAVWSYPITEATAGRVRAELEARRGRLSS
ncbi:MFS transporter [Myxococcota bacterium]|nr:MFS transporter [Myxococcota bacterium]